MSVSNSRFPNHLRRSPFVSFFSALLWEDPSLHLATPWSPATFFPVILCRGGKFFPVPQASLDGLPDSLALRGAEQFNALSCSPPVRHVLALICISLCRISLAGAGDAAAIAAVAAQTDPARLATLKGERAANDRLHKILAWLEEARRGGHGAEQDAR